jgi:type IV secretory pathway VirB4 component
MPESVLESEIGGALIQQTATKIFLPNPNADMKEYMEGFKVTRQEYELIVLLKDDSRMFLVKQGGKSALCRLDLSDFPDDLAILSGSTGNVELVERIIEEFGDDPRVWVPIFHERRKAIKAASRGKKDEHDNY